MSALLLSALVCWQLLVSSGFLKEQPCVVDAVVVYLVELLIEKVCCLCESCICDRADL